MFSGGGGDEEEEASDVSAKKRAKVMAKNQAKRDQESRWEAARVQNAKPAINEESFMQKTHQKVLNAANVLSGMSAWNEKQEERAKQNTVDAARWTGVASIAQAMQEEGKKNTGGKSLAMPALDGGTGWWDTVKGTINDGINQVRNEVIYVATNVKDNAKDAVNSIVTDVSNVWNGSMTLSQAWNNSVAAVRQASDNSLAAMDQGYTNSQRIYRDTVDQIIQKTAVWLDEKRNPFYDLGVYALEQINKKKLIEARTDVFSDVNPLGPILNLGKPDYFDASISFSGGSLLGISKSISLVGIPEVERTNKDFESPDNNQIGIFYAPGVAIVTEGVSLTGSYGTGYMLPGPDKRHPVQPYIDRYLNSFLAIGAGGYFPTIPPLGGSVECYDSMTDLQDIPEQVDDYFGSRATPNLWIAEEIWQEFVSGKDVQDVPKVIGRPQNIINEDAVIGCRVTTGLSTPGVDLHVNISDSQYVSTFGQDWKSINVPTPIMNAIIDLRTPNNWGW